MFELDPLILFITYYEDPHHGLYTPTLECAVLVKDSAGGGGSCRVVEGARGAKGCRKAP